MMLVIRLLDPRGDHTAISYRLGHVEIRPPKLDTDKERAQIEVSAKEFGRSDTDSCMRIVTIVDGDGFANVDAIAAGRFEEALDVKSPELQTLHRVALLDVGAYRELNIGRVHPRRPRRDPTVTAFRVERNAFPAMEAPEYLLANHHIDLCKRLTRSYHWSRKAHLEESLHTRVLFRWFAMEAVWVLDKNDPDIDARVMWALGFPSRKVEQALPAPFMTHLQSPPRYRQWRSAVEQQLHEVKQLRNDSVHAGARFQDVPHNKLIEYDDLTVVACNRVQQLTRMAIAYGVRTARDLVDCRAELTELDPYYATAVHNLISTFEDPHPFWRRWRY